MTEHSYDQLDDLFKEIRLSLAVARKSDAPTANKLKNLVRQLELWVESLVVDSIKLKNLENELQQRRDLVKKLRERLDKNSLTDPDKTHRPVSE